MKIRFIAIFILLLCIAFEVSASTKRNTDKISQSKPSSQNTKPSTKIEKMLIAGFGAKAVLIINAEGKELWRYDMGSPCQEAILLPNGNILAACYSKVCEITPDKKIVWQYESPKNVRTEIHSCQLLPNGNVFFAESGTKKLIEVDRKGKVVKSLTVEVKGNAHTQFRAVRKTKHDTYIAVCTSENMVREYNSSGEVIRTITAKEMADQGVTWKMVHSVHIQPDGLLLVSGGYGASLAIIDNNNKVVRAMNPELKKQLGLKYVAGVDRLSNGHLLVSAYNSNYGVIELDRNFNFVRKYKTHKGTKPTFVQLISQ